MNGCDCGAEPDEQTHAPICAIHEGPVDDPYDHHNL
jgi:hypothetical protein